MSLHHAFYRGSFQFYKNYRNNLWHSELVMIPYHFQIYASVSFFLFCKILSRYVSKRTPMLEKGRPALMNTDKPSDDETICKWIPKKKHEVLKAKYKCLKKLFQIYDASVIGILPEPLVVPDIAEKERKHSRRRRSHRTKTDASAGTNELCEATEQHSIATAVMRDLKLGYATSTPESNGKYEERRDKYTQGSKDYLSISNSEKECEFTQTSVLLQVPCLPKESHPKPTRFQMFLQRLLGIRKEKPNRPPPVHLYAASDNILNDRFAKRRRRGLRFRRIRGVKKIHSETALPLNGHSPAILTYVQSVQKNCLMDTTPRQCPFVGCRTIFYGIINYNDHLNVCHFTERKYFCHYCHEGFLRECDKLVHENEHIGINKLNTITNFVSPPSSDRQSYKVASLTQTEPQPVLDFDEEKLKKIVSFFDKIDDPEEILAELKKSRHSPSSFNLTRHSSKAEVEVPLPRRSVRNSREVYSSIYLPKPDKRPPSSAYSDTVTKRSSASSLKCQMCGDNCDRKRRDEQINSLMVSDTSSEATTPQQHSTTQKTLRCAHPSRDRLNLHSATERQHKHKYLDTKESQHDRGLYDRSSVSTVRHVDTSSNLTDCSENSTSRSCDPSTNIVYYTSLESVRKPSIMDYMAKHPRKEFRYKWEPSTKTSY